MPPSKKPTLADMLRTIASEAPALREAGVLEFDASDFGIGVVKLAPHIAEAAPSEPAKEPGDATEDPQTYGLKPGGRPPGRRWVEDQ